MHSIRTKITLLTVIAIIVSLGIATVISVVSIRKLGREDADQMLHLTATTGAMNLESYFDSVESSVKTVATLVQDSFEGMPFADMENQVERTRNLFGRIAYNTNGVRTYYFRLDPEVAKDVPGFWYVYQEEEGFQEHEVTDISQYDTSDTSSLVWFTVPKATGKGVWLPPYYTENLDVRVISYNVPIYWMDQFVGVIGIEIDYETMAREVEHIRIFQSGYAFILDGESNVIYHPQNDSGQLELETSAVRETDEFIGSNHVQYTYQGVKKEAVWIPLSNGMQLYITAPVSEIDSGWTGMIRIMILAALVILAVSVIVMLRFSNSLTKPLRELTAAAQQIQNGDYDFKLDYNKDDEVGILTDTFKKLADHTKDNLLAARKMATVDSLTGVKNKNAYVQWEEKTDAQIRAKEAQPFAVVVCDINNLKTVNDQFGHKEGDACIKNACARICRVYSHSPVFRIGGDEFVVVLSGEDYSRRQQLLNQINTPPGSRSEIRSGETISAGMAEYKQDRHTCVLNIFEEADEAMFENKKILKASLPQEQQKTESEPVSEYIPVIHNRKHILVADDIEMNREIMGDLLEEDYDISYAADGVETLEVLRANKGEIDLVLLDLIMPRKNGREVIAEMQVDEDLRSIPVVFLTVDQNAELDCLKSGAMDFIPKPYPDIEIVKARIAKCIELSEDRELIRYTERDKLTGLLNKDYFFRYISRLDHLYKDSVMDAIVFDVNHFHSANRQFGRQFGDQVLRSIGDNVKKMARETGGIGCRQDSDIFLLYCPHQENYEQRFRKFTSDVFSDEEIAEKISLRFGVFIDARQEKKVEERFDRAKIAADRVKDDPERICGYYDLV